jgi:hypothetical protein
MTTLLVFVSLLVWLQVSFMHQNQGGKKGDERAQEAERAK